MHSSYFARGLIASAAARWCQVARLELVGRHLPPTAWEPRQGRRSRPSRPTRPVRLTSQLPEDARALLVSPAKTVSWVGIVHLRCSEWSGPIRLSALCSAISDDQSDIHRQTDASMSVRTGRLGEAGVPVSMLSTVWWGKADWLR